MKNIKNATRVPWNRNKVTPLLISKDLLEECGDIKVMIYIFIIGHIINISPYGMELIR